MTRIPPELADAFWSRVRKSDGCWMFMNRWGQCAAGYGAFTFKHEGKHVSVRANRAAYELAYGEIPDGMMICHHCDRPGCVRPDHLFAGTDRDNKRDYREKMKSQKPMAQDEFSLTPRRVSVITGIPLPTLKAMIQSGEVPALKFWPRMMPRVRPEVVESLKLKAQGFAPKPEKSAPKGISTDMAVDGSPTDGAFSTPASAPQDACTAGPTLPCGASQRLPNRADVASTDAVQQTDPAGTEGDPPVSSSEAEKEDVNG